MDPAPSTSQEATTSTSTESTSTERSLKHMISYDVAAFGVPCEFSGLNLPTKHEILNYYFFLVKRAKIENKMHSYKTFTPHVTDKLIEIWSKASIQTINKKSIIVKLNTLLDKYRIVDKNRAKAKGNEKFTEFIQSTEELLYIGKCKCDLKVALCSCELIPEQVKDFMLDQYNERQLTIPEYVTEIDEQTPISSTSFRRESRRCYDGDIREPQEITKT